MEIPINLRLNRRELLKWGGAALLGGVADLRPTPAFGQAGPVCAVPAPAPQAEFEPCSGGLPLEIMPTSPLIGGYVDSSGVVRGSAFTQLLPVPEPLAPRALPASWLQPGQQDSHGHSHQVLPGQLDLPAPVYYRIRLEVGQHHFTSLKALPIDSFGNPVVPPGKDTANPRYLPASTIYGFNGGDAATDACPTGATFPGPMIYAQYGRPALVRFENHLHQNPCSLERGDFGDPNYAFLTHLHNAHTAAESDGNPNHTEEGYRPCEFVENLYLNYPPDGDDAEKQSFLWFHDHKEAYTGANVYKGMVGIYPIYDPILDPGDERSPGYTGKALHLPGVPVPSRDPAAPKRVEYDIPLVLFDCALNDGVTPHKDFHNGCGETHPEWWGQSYFRHFPDRGFVGDVFTVNGVAYPVLEVKRRKYRFRFLDASIARVYNLMLMSSSSSPKAVPGRAGQYQLPNAEQSMRFTQIASEGGLLPFPIDRNSILLSPAKRREVIVDFTRYRDGSPTTKGDCVYLVNVLRMEDGRKEGDATDFDSSYVVPLLKFVIGDWAQDDSEIPYTLRDLPQIDLTNLKTRRFELERSGSGGVENQWLINGLPFVAHDPLAFVKKGVPEIWRIENGGGGWTHPMHFHQEEHRTLSRDGVKVVEPRRPTIDSKGKVRPALATGLHPDDWSKEDTIALEPGQVVVIYRNFRTFHGRYVAHCHNLAHEDHNMMFGWNIV
jgi:FtsP/CotA-like multicopper oxidase with cupredoxin domain